MSTQREKLIKLREKALKDKNLPKFEGANKLVFGAGNPEAEIVMIGEGPGYWEDVKGIPFVGNAGKLLDQALQSIKVPRKEVFITNVVMYRPPNNRDPSEEEIAAFQPYLDGLIDVIQPRVIVTLGRFSMGKFIPGVYISNVHGKSRKVDWQGRKIMVVPMYHPAAALRNGDIKRKFMEDFEKMGELLKGGEETERDSVKEKSDKIESEQMSLV